MVSSFTVRRFAWLAAFAAMSVTSASASAQGDGGDAQADEDPQEVYKGHMRNGVKLFQDENYEAAIVEFNAAYETKPHPDPLINIALSEKALFRYPQAIAVLEKALATHAGGMSTADKKAATDAIEEMRGLLSYLRFDVKPPHTELTIDGETFSLDELPEPFAVGPGKHRIVARATGYGTEERSVAVASGDAEQEIRIELKPDKAYLRVVTGDPEMNIAIDRELVGRGEWAGLLSPGPHLVQMYKNGGDQYDIEVRLEAGKAQEVRPGAGGKLISGSRPMPEVPPPPPTKPKEPEDEVPDKGLFATAGVSLLWPVTHPIDNVEPNSGGAGSLRIGYRVNTMASFDLMAEYENVSVSHASENRNVEYTLRSFRMGPTLKIMTPSRVFRFFGRLGGGLSYEDLEFELDNNEQISDVAATCVGECVQNTTGFAPFILGELGLELDLDGVLLGATFQTYVHSSKGLDNPSGGNPYDDEPIVQLGPGIRAGYAFW